MCSRKTIDLLNATYRLHLSNFSLISDSAIYLARSVGPFTQDPLQLTYQEIPRRESTTTALSPVPCRTGSSSGLSWYRPIAVGAASESAIPPKSLSLFPLIEDNSVTVGAPIGGDSNNEYYLGQHKTVEKVAVRVLRFMGPSNLFRDEDEIRVR